MKRFMMFLPVFCLLLATSAAADVDFGVYARSVGMGGAGLALINEPVAATTMNPAALGVLTKRTNFILPSFNMRSDGAGAGDVLDNLNNIYNLNPEKAADLAKDFGTKDTSLDMDFVTGFTVGSVGLTVDAQAMAKIQPSDEFKQWAETEVIPSGAVLSDYYADVTGQAVASLPSVAMAVKVPSVKPEQGDLWVGARLKLLRGYAHLERTQLQADGTLLTTTVADTEDTGLGADIGMIYKPVGKGGLTYAVAVTNILKPSLGLIDLETVYNLGVAGQPIKGLTWAADLVNISGAYDDNMKIRMGAEYKLGRIASLRAGYSSQAFTYGFGIAGFDFGFSGKSPFTIGRTIIF